MLLSHAWHAMMWKEKVVGFGRWDDGFSFWLLGWNSYRVGQFSIGSGMLEIVVVGFGCSHIGLRIIDGVLLIIFVRC